jgi:hypothetical protein
MWNILSRLLHNWMNCLLLRAKHGVAASKSWDAALGTEIADSGTVDVELALKHDLETGL